MLNLNVVNILPQNEVLKNIALTLSVRVANFMGKPCFQVIDNDKLGDYRDSCISLSRPELDVVINTNFRIVSNIEEKPNIIRLV